MATHPRNYTMNIDEALAEKSAHPDYDVSDFSDNEFESSVSEESEEEVEEDKREQDERGKEVDENEPKNAHGALQGNCGVRRGCG